MKKIVAIVCLLASSYSYSQSIQLFYNKQLVTDTLTISVLPNYSTSEHNLDIVNASSSEVGLVVKRERIFMLQDAENVFCFESCFGPEYDGPTSPPFPFPAGDTLFKERDTVAFFYTTYNPHGKGGVSIIKYTFYNDNNASDATSVIFKFDSGNVGIEDNITEAVNLKVYPNPTTGQLKIDNGQLTIKNIEIFDIVGKRLSRFTFHSSHIEIDISHLAAGIYFLKVDGKMFKVVKE
jgi:hypothetical protein